MKVSQAKVIELKPGKEYIFIFPEDGKDKRNFFERLHKRLLNKGYDITCLVLKDPDKFKVVEK